MREQLWPQTADGNLLELLVIVLQLNNNDVDSEHVLLTVRTSTSNQSNRPVRETQARNEPLILTCCLHCCRYEYTPSGGTLRPTSHAPPNVRSFSAAHNRNCYMLLIFLLAFGDRTRTGFSRWRNQLRAVFLPDQSSQNLGATGKTRFSER